MADVVVPVEVVQGKLVCFCKLKVIIAPGMETNPGFASRNGEDDNGYLLITGHVAAAIKRR